MSVLSFPRIYFKGYIGWDPCTFNNNDFLNTYDAAYAALNFSFLSQYGITSDNFTTTFRPWGIALQDPNSSGPFIPAEWNMFGTHDVAFVQYNNYTTKVIGGESAYGVPVTSDGLIGGLVSINGDNGQGKGKLVDTNPVSFWSSQVYFDQLSFGSDNCMITGTPSVRMHSRWLDLSRIYTQDHFVTQPAAGVACCLQAGIPYDQITWPAPGCSSLASKLQQAASQPTAQGIMVRFTAYVNVYFKNGILNDNTAQAPRNYKELANLLATAWAAWENNGDTSGFFSQPCYSHIVGVVGVWNEGELATVPGGRYLSAVNAVSPPGVTAAQSIPSPQPYSVTHEVSAVAAPTTFLGPVVAEVDYNAKLISLDLNSTMPENGIPGIWPSDLSKTDFGPLVLGVVGSNGAFTAITKIDYTQYSQLPYEAKAGIIDIPFPDSGTGSLLQSNPIALQVQGQTALLEQTQTITAQTDTRGIYLDEGGETEFNVTVCQKGTLSPNTNVLIAKYDQNLALIPSMGPQCVNFTTGKQGPIIVNGITTEITVVTTGPNGIATVGIAAQNPGFPVLAFFPYSGGTVPQPPATLLPSPPAVPLITYAFYTTVRVLSFDNNTPQMFCDFWNSQRPPTSQQAWDFVYDNILYVYDMLFSVMLKYVNLGSQTGTPKSVNNNLCTIWNLIQADLAQESTTAMPITRDMSAGNRLILQLYIYLAYNNFNVAWPLTVNSIPPGWTPCGKKSAFGKTTKKAAFGKTTKPQSY